MKSSNAKLHCLFCGGLVVKQKKPGKGWKHVNRNRDVYDFRWVQGRQSRKLVKGASHTAIPREAGKRK